MWEPFNASEFESMPSFVCDPILLAKDVKHMLTHRVLLADFYLLELKDTPNLPEDYIWIDEERIEDYGVPRLIEMMFEMVK